VLQVSQVVPGPLISCYPGRMNELNSSLIAWRFKKKRLNT
jgi:hypothetical protein